MALEGFTKNGRGRCNELYTGVKLFCRWNEDYDMNLVNSNFE